MNKKIKVSIIIIGYYGKQYLHDCISSLIDQYTDIPYEVIFADNNSNDGSVDFVKSNFKLVKVVELKKNIGYYAAFNLIAQDIAIGQYMIALPQDTIVHKKFITELVNVADSDERIKICLANTINPGSPDYLKREREKNVKYVYLMGTSRLGVTLPQKWPFEEHPIPILAYSGVSALIKRDAFPQEIGFFDPKISHFLGDVDLGIRTNIVGNKVVLVPTANVYHIEDNKSWSDNKLLYRSFLGARDTYVVYYKNMYLLEFIFFIPFLLFGIPTKVFALRTNLMVKFGLFIISFLLSPIVFIFSLQQLKKVSKDRRIILEHRKNGRLWLFLTIILQKLR